MPPEADPPRAATAADAPAIAALHARSWRSAYRGSFSDAYLDGLIVAERAAFWQARMAQPGEGQVTLLLPDAEGALVGFVCGFIGKDPRWGTLVDNLHVDPDRKGRGSGRRLMRGFADVLAAQGPQHPVHLFALASNANARAFYLRLGGTVVERLTNTEPDGSQLPLDRIAWPTCTAFVEGTR